MKNAKEIYMYLLGALITIGFFLALAMAVIYAIPEVNHDLVMFMFGVLGAKFGDVVGYFFGSSKSSADKTELMATVKPDPAKPADGTP